MSREKYLFNPTTLQYEKQQSTVKSTLLSTVKFASAVVFTSLLLFALGYKFFPTPKEKALERDITQMEYYYESLSKQFDELKYEGNWE